MAAVLEPGSLREKVRANAGLKGHPPPRKRPWRWVISTVVVGYALALSASAYQRWRFQNSPTSFPRDKRSLSVSAVVGDQILPKKVTMAFRDIPAQSDSDGIPLLLIHGS